MHCWSFNSFRLPLTLHIIVYYTCYICLLDFLSSIIVIFHLLSISIQNGSLHLHIWQWSWCGVGSWGVPLTPVGPTWIDMNMQQEEGQRQACSICTHSVTRNAMCVLVTGHLLISGTFLVPWVFARTPCPQKCFSGEKNDFLGWLVAHMHSTYWHVAHQD